MINTLINIFLSFFVVLPVAAICFWIIIALGHPKEIASAFAAVCFLAFPTIHKSLQDKEIKLNLSLMPETIVPMKNYNIQWYFMLMYSSVLLISIYYLSNAYTTFMIIYLSDLNDPYNLIPMISMPFIFFGAYFVGRWVGIRCDKYGIIIVVGSFIIARGAISIYDYTFINESDNIKIYGNILNYTFIVKQIVGTIIYYGGIALVGYWKGRKTRLARYIEYLLRLLPPDTRSTIVDLTYEEARMIGRK